MGRHDLMRAYQPRILLRAPACVLAGVHNYEQPLLCPRHGYIQKPQHLIEVLGFIQPAYMLVEYRFSDGESLVVVIPHTCAVLIIQKKLFFAVRAIELLAETAQKNKRILKSLRLMYSLDIYSVLGFGNGKRLGKIS